MDRRQFCRTAFAAGCVAASPFITPRARPVFAAAKANTNIPAVSLSGDAIELEAAAVRELGGSTKGPVLLSGHPDYNGVRKIWNGMHDKRPALIVRCESATDISQAVTFARERELLVAVRGGGHSWPGKSVCDGGMMIDLAPLNTVKIDAENRRAFAGGGALLNTLDNASRQHGLITTAGVVSHTGVGGFTLGGGYGRLNRKFGLAIDNLQSVEITTASGKTRRASDIESDDLFWAVRGGGGNFGVVSEFEFQLYPFELKVFSGMIAWPIKQARDVLEFYGEWSPGLSDDMYAGPVMATTPEGQGMILMEVVYAGDPRKGEKELAPLLRVGTPESGVKLNDYMMMQTQEDVTFAHGVRSYAKNGMVKQVTQGLVDAMLDAYIPDPRIAFFTHTAGGAVKRVDEIATAFPHRNAETMLIIAGAWTEAAQDEEAIALAREWFYQLEPFTGGYYDNIEYEGDDGAAKNFGPVYDRLLSVKKAYDPSNLFRLNSNINPMA